MGNTKPIGVAYSDQDISGADSINAALISGAEIYATEELGYTAAAQGAVTQLTDKSTAVTLNKAAGQITMNNAALAGNTAVQFTMNNSYISANDILVLNIGAGAVADPAAYTVYVSNLAAGTALITVRNLTGTSRSEALVLNFALIHCV
jgi:hypothetical protein